MEKITVLYEDNHLIAVAKPAGVLIDTLQDQVKEYIKEKYKKPGNVFLGMIHQLDRNVRGITLFAKTSKGASRLSLQFREHTVEKIYEALVEGELPASGTLQNFLVHDERENYTKVYDHEVSRGQYAELSFTAKGNVARITLETGRQHQIRAQFSHIGHPLVGDTKYGSKTSFPDQHIELCAVELSFMTATGDERKKIVYDSGYGRK